MNIPLFINAKADTFLRSGPSLSEEEKLTDVLKRDEAYISAGADCLFPIGLSTKETIRQLVFRFFPSSEYQGVAHISPGPGIFSDSH